MQPDRASLETLLDAVHAALREGDFASLAGLTAAADNLTAEGLPQDPAMLRGLQHKLQRNCACLLAAARGLRAARRRIAEIATARSGLQTYTQGGQRQQIGAAQGMLAQRF